MTTNTIDVGADFSVNPRGLYYSSSSDVSAERFREEFLKPVFTRPHEYERPVKVVLDTALGYAANFLEEAFGGLVREGYATPEEVDAAFEFVYDEFSGFSLFEEIIRQYVHEAKPAAVRAVI